jgi:2-oxoglutarate ferredoxin oxidoreductase subunit gamma
MADEAGTDRAANFVMLGAYVGATGVVPAEVVEAEIENEFTGRKAKFAPTNIAAFRAGLAEGQKVQVTA